MSKTETWLFGWAILLFGTLGLGSAEPVPLSRASVEPQSNSGKDAFADLKKDKDGVWQLSFRQLASFDYLQEDPLKRQAVAKGKAVRDPIPARVRAFDGERVCLPGYMLPLTWGKFGKTKNFLIIRSQMGCCFGVAPAPTEIIYVTMKNGGAEVKMDVPLMFLGTLHTKERYENGEFLDMYQLDCEKIFPRPEGNMN